MKVRLTYALAGHQTYQVWCNPILKQGKVETSQKQDSLIFKDEFTGSLIFYNSEVEGIYDYDTIRNLPTDCVHIRCELFNECCDDNVVVINAGGRPSTADYVGYFTRYWGTYDNDLKTYEVTPKTEDAFLSLKAVLDKEIDVYSITPVIPLKSSRGVFLETATYTIPNYNSNPNSYPADELIYFSKAMYDQEHSTDNPINSAPMLYDWVSKLLIKRINHYFDFSQNGSRSNEHWYVSHLLYHGYYPVTYGANLYFWPLLGFTVTLTRTVTWTFDDDNGNHVLPGTDPAMWYPEHITVIGGLPAMKWIRILPFTYMTQDELKDGNPTTLLTPLWYRYYGNEIKWNPPTDNIIKYNFGRSLIDILNTLLQGSGLTFESKLIQDPISPLTGQANNYYNLYLINKSDAVMPTASNQVWKWPIVLNDLLEDLKVIFNADYDVIGNKLVFENNEYWANGLSYSIPKPIQLDLTTQMAECLIESDAWKYDLDLQPRREKFSFNDGKTLDWMPENISYHFSCTNDQVKERITSILTTDLQMCQMLTQQNQTGYVLVATSPFIDGDGYRVIPFGASYFGIESSPNMLLSWSALIQAFYFYQRVYKEGTWGSNTITFNSYRKYRIQKELTVPLCCLKLSPYKLIKTYLGNGEVNSLELNLATGVVKITLLYDYE